uniref:Putative secreted protein n=1 Tax=Panstrongylus lignarius TaxID=156445 RepID=A0A224XXQ1_9HEMI
MFVLYLKKLFRLSLYFLRINSEVQLLLMDLFKSTYYSYICIQPKASLNIRIRIGPFIHTHIVKSLLMLMNE